MAQSSYPHEAGTGYQTSESQWAEMARHWLRTGVIRGLLNSLEVFADASAMQVKVRTGSAFVEGYFYTSSAEEALSISGADLTNPRIDRVVLRLDRAANTVLLAIVAGTAAGSPAVPAIAQTAAGVYEISLAQVRVNAGVSNIAADKITDERPWAQALTDGATEFVEPGGLDFQTASASPVAVTGLLGTIKTNGGNIRVDLGGFLAGTSTAGTIQVFALLDGATSKQLVAFVPAAVGQIIPASAWTEFAGVSAGSHTVQITMQTSAGTATFGATRRMELRELRK